MRQIVVTIDVKNDAMETYPEAEVSEIFSELKHMALYGLDWIDGMVLSDSNGNTVGKSVIKTVKERV